MTRNTDLDVPQGDDEERTEAYQEYSEGVPEASTTRDAKSGNGAAGSAGRQAGAVRSSQNESMEEAIMFAKKYLEDLLSFFGLNTDVYATTEDDEVIELDIPSTHLNGFLIGSRGDTVRALQYTISNALRNKNFSHTRVNVDVADYKKNRAERIVKNVEEWFRHVRDSGQTKELLPMSAADRRAVHKAAVDYGLNSESSGVGRDRHIVLKPAEGQAKADAKPATEPEQEVKAKPKAKAKRPAKPADKDKTETKPKAKKSAKSKKED